MGNQTLKLIRQNFLSGKWTHLYSSYSKNVVQNQKENQVGELQSIASMTDSQKEIAMYVFRKLNPQYLVTIHDIIIKQKSALNNCVTCDQFQHFQVVVERIPYKFPDVGVLSFQQMVYVMDCCAKGLHTIWKKYGKNYYIDEDNICFNNQGKCKIWINQELKYNFPVIQTNLNQQAMIGLVFQDLQSRVSMQLPKYYLKQKKSTSFQKFSEFLNFISKIKEHYKISIDHIEALVQKPVKNGDSDSKQAQSNYNKSLEKNSKSAFKIKQQKYSLRRQRNSKSKITKTTHSKQEQTVVSRTQLYENFIDTQSIEFRQISRQEKPPKTLQRKSVRSAKIAKQFKKHVNAHLNTQNMAF